MLSSVLPWHLQQADSGPACRQRQRHLRPGPEGHKPWHGLHHVHQARQRRPQAARGVLHPDRPRCLPPAAGEQSLVVCFRQLSQALRFLVQEHDSLEHMIAAWKQDPMLLQRQTDDDIDLGYIPSAPPPPPAGVWLAQGCCLPVLRAGCGLQAHIQGRMGRPIRCQCRPMRRQLAAQHDGTRVRESWTVLQHYVSEG